MPYEIERKFLVTDEKILDKLEGTLYRQAYMSTAGRAVVRIRVVRDNAYITIKGDTDGIKRLEYEYAIPKHHATEMINELCDGGVLEKIRYSVMHKGHKWVIDKFIKENLGLVVAEIELDKEDEIFELPDWVGEEVTEDVRYYNVNLVKNPYVKWDIDNSL